MKKDFQKGHIPWNKGKQFPQMKGNKFGFKKGKPSWNKGKPSPWTSKRNKETNHLMRGEKAYHWKGGKHRSERARDMARQEYKQWRSNVFQRDCWTCQTCQAKGVYLEAHHIKAWAKYPDLRYALSNGVTLCLPCHKLAFDYKNK